MMKLVLLVALCCFAGLAAGQTVAITSSQCELWQDAPLHCKFILDPFNNGSTPVWVSRSFGITQEFLNARLWSFLDLAYGLPQPCLNLYLRLICPTLYQPCVPFPGDPTQAVPLPPCYSVCREFIDTCGAAIPSEVLPLFADCNAPNSFAPSRPQWPNASATTPCSLMEGPFGEVEFACPKGLHFYAPGDPKLPQPALLCAMTCRDFITVPTGYRQGKTQDAWIEQSCFAAISCALTVFLLITLVLFPPTRQWPRRITIFVCIGVLFTLTALVGDITFGSSTDLFCDADRPFVFEPSTWCKYSGWALYFGALVVLLWWDTQAIVLFWNVALLKSPLLLAKAEPLFHIINWCYPMVASFIMLGLDEFGSLPGYPYCFVRSDAPVGLTWGLFFAILAASVLFVLVVIVAVMVRLAKESTLKETLWSRWKYQLQLGVFMIYFLFTVVYILALRSWYEDNRESLEDAVAGVYQCLVRGNLPENCVNDVYLNHYLYFSNTFLVSGIGLAVFIVFFCMNDFNRNLWPLAYRNWKEGRDVFFLPGTGGSGSSAGSGASSASSSADEAAQQRRSNRTFRRKLAAEAPSV